MEQVTGYREQGTGNREQGAGSREQGTGSREQGTGNREQRTLNREQGTANRERRMGIWERVYSGYLPGQSASLILQFHFKIYFSDLFPVENSIAETKSNNLYKKMYVIT